MNTPQQAPATPQPRLRRLFELLVRRDGKTTRRTEWATTWFDVWSNALDEHGLDCRIEVKPLEVA